MTPSASRRDLIAAPLLAAAFALTRGGPAVAAGVDPKMTAITPPDDIAWKPVENMPSAGTSSAALFGKASDPGQYFVLVRWNPGLHERAALVRDRPALHGAFRAPGIAQAERISRPRKPCP